MIIYIEVVLIVNLLINLFTILIIKECFYLKIKKTIILSFILDMIYMLLYIYEYNINLLKFLLPVVLIFLSFRVNKYLFLKSVLAYYLISYTLGGISTTLKLSGNLAYFIILIFLIILVFIFYVFFHRKDIFITYKIKYVFKDKTYHLNAFFDTGCNLIYKGLPVVILNKKYHFNIYSDEKIFYISGGTQISEKIYRINNLEILKNKIDCYCIFLDIDYDAIIGVNIITL